MEIRIILLLIFSCFFSVVLCGYCDQYSLSFPGLKKVGTRYFLDGEEFLPSCDEGYELARPGEKIMCRGGTWNGYFPPCNVANCHTVPPSIPNGRAKSHTGMHGSIAEYECNEFYFLAYQSTVQCVAGEWIGNPPICKDARCFIRTLKNKNGVLNNNRPTLSGEFLNVSCSGGFSPSGMKPTCSRGEWIEQGPLPCKPMNCPVQGIRNGTLKEPIEKKAFNFGKFRNERRMVLVEVTKGEVRPPGHQLYFNCHFRNAFQGSAVITTCKEGKWQPEPHCLPRRK